MTLLAPLSLAGRHRRWTRLAFAIALLIGILAPSLPIQLPAASAATVAIRLPVPSGTQMRVTQGYNTDPTKGGSHYSCVDYPSTGCANTWAYKYSADLVRTSGTTAGTTVLSPVNGTIRWIDTAYGGMSIDLGNGWAVAYFHTSLASGLAAGQKITQGQYMGTIAQPGQGGNGGFPHIHVTLWQTNDGGNWNRTAKPFTGTYRLDGVDLPAKSSKILNQYVGTLITSTNKAVGGTSIPRQVAKTSPAHGSTINTSTVTLTWAAVNGATSYQVQLDGGTVASSWISGTTWTTPPLNAGSHTWNVRARNSVGTGNPSSTWRFTVVLGVQQSATIDNGGKLATGVYQIYATRQGMVGGTTSSGHVITENDHFVSLPACVKTTCSWLTPGTTSPTYGYVTDCGSKCYVMIYNPKTDKCQVSPVLDRGPLFNIDDYWNATSTRYLNQKIAAKDLPYRLAQGYTGDAAALDGYDVGYGKTGNTGNSNLKYSNGDPYVPSFPTSMDVGDGSWLDLGFPWDPGPQVVQVTMLWQVGTSVADATTRCNGPDPYATLSKSSGTPYTPITVNAKYFQAGETAKIYIDSTASTPLSTATVGSNGRFSDAFSVPNIAGGKHTIIIVGSTSGKRVDKPFTIMPRETMQPSSGSANITVTLRGYNFAAGELVRAYWDSSATVVGTGTAGADGKVVISVRSPLTNGPHTAKLVGATNNLTARATYTVIQRVRTRPTSGSSSTSVLVYGTGWPANVTVQFRWNSANGTVLCSDVTDATGYASCTFKPSGSAPNGSYRIYGSDGTRTSSTTFTVTGFGTSEDEATATLTATAAASPIVEASPVVEASPIVEESPTVEVTMEATATETIPAASPTEVVTEIPTELPTDVPTATATAEPTTIAYSPVANTSVNWATPEAGQAPEANGTLTIGGSEGAVTYLSFDVAGLPQGTVTSVKLLLNATTAGQGGAVGVLPGTLIDESSTPQTLPSTGINAAYGSDGNPSLIGNVDAGGQIAIDVTMSVQADGQYTFVLTGDAATLLQISSREGSAPPLLIVTIQP
ncbi:MAG TPA: peptidoglycan DD-metalloendopeptidase family protein [Thermomicrobiales bacterium]|nr:peptidoglycan DD-metalloendopeptidase family protein [Thermomicrobiales bacterium]